MRNKALLHRTHPCEHGGVPTNKVPISSQHTLNIWNHLVERATSGRTITYSELAERVYGNRASQAVSQPLKKLISYCKQKGLPLLPILAVSKRTGRPSAGPEIYPDVRGETDRVFSFDWSKVSTPTPTDLDRP